ncbi:MAG TPA: NAD(P)/FAD-dependent oxidoreductase [Acidimicrobiales bacterium]|nr:NAD(P)/FAD-dependent oxidoreductase [Acidimicrobiales bacterium]
MHDAVVVGSGPNGLAAAVHLARAGASVLVVEQHERIGGGCRSAELTLAGHVHDVCSAVHPLAVASPFLRSLPLEDHGLRWRHPEVAVAHPLDGGPAAALAGDAGETARDLGDARWRHLLDPLVRRWDDLASSILGPVLRVPAHPLVLARFGIRTLWPASVVAGRMLASERAQALFAGIAAHAVEDLRRPLTSSAGLVLAAAGHARGWPVAEGGSQRIVDALASYLATLGGSIECGRRIAGPGDLPQARAVLFDTAPRDLLAAAGARLPHRYRRRLERFRHGAGTFKVDYALDGPVPWRSDACRRAGTVHLGGTAAEIVHAESEVAAGRHPEHPFVLVGQQSLVDPSRAPAGRHTLWAYCHVPAGSTRDMTAAVEAQLERFAPGFGDRVLARVTTTSSQLEAYNPNCVGGDIAGGANDAVQLLFRPMVSLHPYRTPARGLFLCSASTPPGAGVHGMCGYWAARDALRFLERCT